MAERGATVGSGRGHDNEVIEWGRKLLRCVSLGWQKAADRAFPLIAESDIGKQLVLHLRSQFCPLLKPSFEPLPCQLLSPRGVHMRRREFLGALGGQA